MICITQQKNWRTTAINFCPLQFAGVVLQAKVYLQLMQKAVARAHAAVLCTNLFFAANFSLVKLIAPRLVAPFGLNVFRVGGSLILFWALWLLGKTGAGIQRRHWGRFLFCALTGVAINQLLFLKGLTLTSTVHASLLMLCTPLLISVAAWWLYKEEMTPAKGAGLLLGVSGAVLLIAGRESGAHAVNPLLGDTLIIINAVSYSVYFIAVKPLMQVYSAVHVIRWVFSLGFVMILPFAWHEATAVQFALFTATDFAILAAIIITGTFLAYYFNAIGIQVLGAATTGAYIYTQPLFAVLIAVIILGEGLSLQKAIAAVLIFAGVYLVNLKRKEITPPARS